MKYFKAALIFFTLLFILVGCSFSTKNNASPKRILQNNSEADIFIIDNVVYHNALDVMWVKELTLEADGLLGKIERTCVKENFNNWDATKLDVNTEIYQVAQRNDILLAKVGAEFVPYLKYIEG